MIDLYLSIFFYSFYYFLIINLPCDIYDLIFLIKLKSSTITKFYESSLRLLRTAAWHLVFPLYKKSIPSLNVSSKNSKEVVYYFRIETIILFNSRSLNLFWIYYNIFSFSPWNNPVSHYLTLISHEALTLCSKIILISLIVFIFTSKVKWAGFFVTN